LRIQGGEIALSRTSLKHRCQEKQNKQSDEEGWQTPAFFVSAGRRGATPTRKAINNTVTYEQEVCDIAGCHLLSQFGELFNRVGGPQWPKLDEPLDGRELLSYESLLHGLGNLQVS